MKDTAALALLFCCVMLFAGCVSMTNFQSPEVLPPHRFSVGMGLAYMIAPEGDLMGRYGLGGNADVGVKLAIPFPSISADLKWQILRHPLLLALDFGGSYGWFADMPDAGNDYDHISVYPELLVGSHRVYAAVRAMRYYQVRHVEWTGVTEVTGKWVPQFFAGGSFGARFRVIPELQLTVPLGTEESSPVIPGLGLSFQYRL